MKDLLKSTAISIGISMTIFCVIGIIFDIICKGSFSMSNFGFTKMVLGCLFTGIGFGAPTFIYNRDNIPRPVQVLTHLGIGFTVYLAVALYVGWIPVSLGIAKCLLIIAGQLAVASIIWILFMMYYRKEAKEINLKLKEKR